MSVNVAGLIFEFLRTMISKMLFIKILSEHRLYNIEPPISATMPVARATGQDFFSCPYIFQEFNGCSCGSHGKNRSIKACEHPNYKKRAGFSSPVLLSDKSFFVPSPSHSSIFLFFFATHPVAAAFMEYSVKEVSSRDLLIIKSSYESPVFHNQTSMF